MADIKQAFGTSTAITITLGTPLTNGSARESVSIDNDSDLFLDALVLVSVQLASGTPSGDQSIYVYAYGSEDGTNFTDNATGSDANITLRSPTNLRLIGVISTPDSGALTYDSHPMSVAAAFGGVMPRDWGIVVENQTGLSFGSTEGNHTKTFSGVFATST